MDQENRDPTSGAGAHIISKDNRSLDQDIHENLVKSKWNYPYFLGKFYDKGPFCKKNYLNWVEFCEITSTKDRIDKKRIF